MDASTIVIGLYSNLHANQLILPGPIAQFLWWKGQNNAPLRTSPNFERLELSQPRRSVIGQTIRHNASREYALLLLGHGALYGAANIISQGNGTTFTTAITRNGDVNVAYAWWPTPASTEESNSTSDVEASCGERSEDDNTDELGGQSCSLQLTMLPSY